MTVIQSDEALLLSGRTVLVIEDDPIVALTMMDDLKVAGADVRGPIETVEDAMADLMAGTPFDAALIDAHLKDGSANKVIQALIALDKPYILVTGDENFGLMFSTDAPCVTKPVDMSDVIRKLVVLIGEVQVSPAAATTPLMPS